MAKSSVKSLLIVESPTKVQTLKKILGKDFIVKASVGHLKDLPIVVSGSIKTVKGDGDFPSREVWFENQVRNHSDIGVNEIA